MPKRLHPSTRDEESGSQIEKGREIIHSLYGETTVTLTSQQSEIFTLMERVDELSVTEGVDSEEYESAFQKLLLKQKEYGMVDILENPDENNHGT